MSSFEDRVAAEKRAAQQAAGRGDAEAEKAIDEAAAARRRAEEMLPMVNDAIAAVAALPLPAPYKSLWWDQPSKRKEHFSIHLDGPFRQVVSMAEEMKKPLFGNKGTVTPVGWRFSIGSALFGGSSSFGVEVRSNGTARFTVWVAPFGSTEYQLRDLCEKGVIRWGGGTGKDTSWSGGQIRVPEAFDLFLALAAKLVAARTD